MIGQPREGEHRLGAQPAERLHGPLPWHIVDPGETNERRRALKDQVREDPAREVGRSDAFADVAAGGPEPAVTVERDERPAVTRRAQHAAPTVRDSRIADCRQHGSQRRFDGGKGRIGRLDAAQDP